MSSAFRSYVKTSLWEFVLCCFVAVSLGYVLLDGFNVASWIQFGPLPAVLSVVCTAALYCIGSSKQAARIGVPLYCLALVLVWGACIVAAPDFLSDDAENLLTFAMCVTLTATLVYVLARWRVGTVLVFAAGVVLIGFIQFFYQGYWLLWDVAFLCGSLALIMFKNFLSAVRLADSASNVSFVGGASVSVIAALVVAAIGAGVWFGVVAPMNPGAVEVKIFTKYMSVETLQVKGTSQEKQVPNTDMTSSDLNDDSRTTDDLVIDQKDGTPQAANPDEEPQDDADSQGGSFLGVDLDSADQDFNVEDTAPLPQVVAIALLAVLLVLVLGYFLGRRAWRRRRLARWRQTAPREQAVAMYLFLQKRFSKLKLGIPVGLTALEHARSSRAVLERFDVDGVSFYDLTCIYASVVYGKHEPSSHELEALQGYYLNFWRSARAYLGNFKYFFKSFVL